MHTEYPFQLPDFDKELPRLGSDGVTLLDVRVNGKWEGVLVVNARRECIGIRYNRGTVEWELPFRPHEIEDFRPASISNRFLAANPEWYLTYPYACTVLLPLVFFAKPAIGVLAPVGTIVIGIPGIIIVINNIRWAFCITGLPLVLYILAMDVLASAEMIRLAIRSIWPHH